MVCKPPSMAGRFVGHSLARCICASPRHCFEMSHKYLVWYSNNAATAYSLEGSQLPCPYSFSRGHGHLWPGEIKGSWQRFSLASL